MPEAELRSFDWHRLSLSLLADHLTGGCCESRQVKHRAPSSASGYLPAVKFGRQLIRVRIEALAQRLRKIPAD